MRNTLIAGGPSFKSGVRVGSPTGNVDLAPTALRILGLPGANSMDGRVLEEALADGPDPASVDSTTEVYEAEREIDDGGYRQQITVSKVGNTTYVDQGVGDRFFTA
jgi:arylsulfatase A-like enzyme